MDELPFLTNRRPGIGGNLKHVPADFLVEEIPSYPPSGSGDHLFLCIEKEDVSAEQFTKRLVRGLGVKRSEIGMAGMKDRRAITRQYVSVPARCHEAVASWEQHDIRILSAVRHGNKLKTGHLRGNRFTIRVREPFTCSHEIVLDRASAIAEEIGRRGFPNFYGTQRFGHQGETLAMGLALLRGEITASTVRRKRDRSILRLALSAVQSELFNRALADRIDRDDFETVLPGDVMRKRDSGGLFVAEDAAAEQLRFESGETDITGPMFGPRMIRPGGTTAAVEIALLQDAVLPLEAFQQHKKLTPGSRRAFRVMPTGLDVSPDPDGIVVKFSLPAGAYATVLLREFMKYTTNDSLGRRAGA